MEGKNKIALFLLSALATTACIFCCASFARAADDSLVISEILIGGSSADEEFIEIYNSSSMDIDLKLLPLKLHIINSLGSDTSKALTYTSSDYTIKAGGYFLLASAAFKERHSEINIGITYSASLVSNGAVYISTSATKNSDIIDSTCWGTSIKCAFPLPNPKQNYSLERLDNGPDWQESCEAGGTPGKESTECEKEQDPPKEEDPTETENEENVLSDKKVFLNEIFPNPKKDSNAEYIEIVNSANEPVDLFGWHLKDASKGKGYQFKDHTIIESGEYLAIYRPESKITLNNSAESVYLYDPQEKITSSASFKKSQKNSSYNFDGKNWKWSKYITPGEKNKFDSEPSVTIKKPKHAYKNFHVEFSTKAKDKETKKLKYAWDFGDGQKSYLKKTSHKYLATGKYTVTLSVSDDSQTIQKSFTLKVKNYPRPNLEIVKLIPNPAGNDSEKEIIYLKNSSSKKIDLANWKIATGSDDKMYNHPIENELIIELNETKPITREFSKFSLNNKTGKVRLVSPDEKIVDEVEYSKEKIAEDEAYLKINDEWQWIAPSSQDEIVDEESSTAEEPNEDVSDDGEVLGATDKNESITTRYDSTFTSEDAFIFLSQISFANPVKEKQNYCSADNSSSAIAYLLASLI